MRKIELYGKYGNGKYVIVDDEDFNWLNQWKWRTYKNKSVARGTRKNKIYKTYYMHNVIMNTPKGFDTDHKNGNRLDNRRSNLRICTHAENMRNQKPKSNHYKGITWYKRAKKWTAKLRKDKKDYHIGYFDSEIEAAKAYNKVAKKYHGEFARLNIIN